MKLLLILLSSLFMQGNEAYANQDYAQAVTYYEEVLNTENNYSNASIAMIYYNLGNAYFKTNALGKAILSYERALRMQPNNKDAQHNLKFAQSRIIDNIEDHNSFFLRQWAISCRNMLTTRGWMTFSIVLFLLFLGGALCFAFMPSTMGRQFGFHIGWIALIFTVITLSLAFSAHHQMNRTDEAIIMQGIVNAKSSPDRSGTDLFVMHEGTKVVIKETVGEWVNVQVGDNIGWIRSYTIEKI